MIPVLLSSLAGCANDLRPTSTSTGAGGASSGSGQGGSDATGATSATGSGGAGGSGGTPAVPVPGLRAEYFAGYLDLVLEQIEPTLDHDWADGAPAASVGKDRFSARWTGLLVAP
jgi:hypothetical protein